jgi:hypothetical protein
MTKLIDIMVAKIQFKNKVQFTFAAKTFRQQRFVVQFD